MKIDLNKVKTYSIKQRFSKVKKSAFAKVPAKGGSFQSFYKGLPEILKASDFRRIVEAVITAARRQKPVIFMMGAHVIKCGLSPLVIDLLKKKIISAVALNGAGIIHDFELAYQGKTSEDVAAALKAGSFGMSRETAEFLNNAVKEGVQDGLGIGESVGRAIAKAKCPYRRYSILYNCYNERVPVSVHVAIGTDIIHQHPSFDGASAGRGSQRGFLLLVQCVAGIGKGGGGVKFCSTAILPFGFFKALNLARNLGHKVHNFTT